jgi:hypothetical protein
MQKLTLLKLGRFWAPILVAVLVISACTDEQTRENNRLRQKIIEVHDQAMEKIGYMYELEITLQSISKPDSVQKKSIDDAISRLQNANKSMFEWMHQYQTLAVDKEPEIDNTYRHQQLVLIRDVQRLTDKSIALSETLLQKK